MLWLVLGAGACSLLVRGTIDDYPEADGDGDSDADSDSDTDSDGDGDADAGVDGACVGEDGGVPGLAEKCEAFCEEQIPCPGTDLNETNCPDACRCYFGQVYKPGFARSVLGCLHDDQVCVVSDEGTACVLAAYEFVDAESCAAFVELCTRRAANLGCGAPDGGPSIDCGLAPALQPATIDGWEQCLGARSCRLINGCRDGSFLEYCGVL